MYGGGGGSDVGSAAFLSHRCRNIVTANYQRSRKPDTKTGKLG